MNIRAKSENGANYVEMDVDGMKIAAFSYGVLVAVRAGAGKYKTSEYHSTTTSKHVNAFFGGKENTKDAVELSPHDLNEKLIITLSGLTS